MRAVQKSTGKFLGIMRVIVLLHALVLREIYGFESEIDEEGTFVEY